MDLLEDNRLDAFANGRCCTIRALADPISSFVGDLVVGGGMREHRKIHRLLRWDSCLLYKVFSLSNLKGRVL